MTAMKEFDTHTCNIAENDGPVKYRFTYKVSVRGASYAAHEAHESE